MIKMSSKCCRAVVFNVKDGMTIGCLKSYVWSGTGVDVKGQMMIKVDNVTQRVYYFDKKFKLVEIGKEGLLMMSDFVSEHKN